MDRYISFLSYFYKSTLIPVNLYSNGECLKSFCPIAFSIDFAFVFFEKEILSKKENFGYSLFQTLYCGYIRLDEDCFVTVGPVSDYRVPMEKLAEILNKYNFSLDYLTDFSNYISRTPVISENRIRASVRLISSLSDVPDTTPITFVSDEPEVMPVFSDLHTLKPDRDIIKHDTEELENRFMNALMHGKSDEVFEIMTSLPNSDIYLGRFNLTTVKSTMNALVAITTILSRAAYSAGMDYDDALTIQDYYIEMAEQTNNKKEIVYLLGASIIDYCAKIKKLHQFPDTSPIIKAICSDVATNLYSSLKVSEIAQRLQYSVPYLSAAFAKETGISLKQYIIREKIDEAKYLLEKGNSISEVSTLLYFSSISHFQTCFKNETAMTPGEFQKSLK